MISVDNIILLQQEMETIVFLVIFTKSNEMWLWLSRLQLLYFKHLNYYYYYYTIATITKLKYNPLESSLHLYWNMLVQVWILRSLN